MDPAAANPVLSGAAPSLLPAPPVLAPPTAPAARPAALLTDQQGRAVTTRQVSVVLSSGAGCGKTHVLTERFLSHLRDDDAEVGQIVAITFTDRAARQMRDRIRRSVTAQLLAAASDDEAARWDRHLRNLETAQVSTIHAFCGSLLRQYAFDAGLDPGFDVLDEVLAANFRADAYAQALQDLLTAGSPTGHDLEHLVVLYGWRPVVAAVEHLVGQVDGPAWDRWVSLTAEEAARRWREDERTDLRARYIPFLLATSPRLRRCLTLLRETPCLGAEMRRSVQLLLDETPLLATAPDLAESLDRLIAAARVGRERGTAWPSEEVYREVQKALEGYRTELKERLTLFTEDPAHLVEEAAVGQRFLRVAQEVAQAYQARKRRAGCLDFQDLLVLARDLLRDHPAVREALQRRFRFLLVDELQDTDPVQMEVIESLCGGEQTSGKLFAVGDAKQSIYRFRGADVALFERLRFRMPHEGRQDLSLNFRSQPQLLHFTNALFDGLMPGYEALRPHQPQVTAGPTVEFLWTARDPAASAGEARAAEADTLARRIAALVAGEPACVDRSEPPYRPRPVRPGDVVVLFRSMTNVALYEAALRRQGLDYYLVGGRAFFAQQEVYDILNLLRALENPLDAVSLAGALRSPFCCLSDESLLLLSRHPDGPWGGLHDACTLAGLPDGQRRTAARARDSLRRWRAARDRLPIAGLVQLVIAESAYDAALQFEFLGDRKLANLWKLVDLARAFDRTGLFGLAEFIARLGDLVARQPREEQAATQPENADVVRLMTVHQAKGLEFPVVIVPDLAARVGGTAQPAAAWDARLGCVARPPGDEDPEPFPDFAVRLAKARETIDDWHEDLRTSYVACTRAQDHLVLSASLPTTLTADGPWMLALADRFDPRTGACRHPRPAGEEPRVRVLTPADIPPLPPSRSAAVPVTGMADLAPGGIDSVPVRLGHVRVVTVAQIDQLAALPRGRKRAVPLASLFEPFATEDGSDQYDWNSGDMGLTLNSPAWWPLFREAARLWDFGRGGDWRDLLTAAGSRAGSPPALAEIKAAETALSRLAAPLPAGLARPTRSWDVEFLLDLAGDGGLFGPQVPAAVRGTVDVTARDEHGRWYLAVLRPGSAARRTARRKPAADDWPLALALAVCAAEQVGRLVAAAAVFDAAEGRWHTTDPASLPRADALRRAAEAIDALRRLTPGM